MSDDVTPPTQQPETLDSHAGAPLAKRPRSRRRTVVLTSAAAVGALALGGAAWAVTSFLSTGAQPAEALPGNTLAYVSVDLDPSGGQKIEALKTLRKFPAFKEHVGLDTDDDVRGKIIDLAREASGCDLDAKDITSWLGNRYAVAAVEKADGSPTPIVVLQVSDEGAAEDGIPDLLTCDGSSADGFAVSVSDGWALIAESGDVLDDVAKDVADGTLADDSDFRHWTSEAGESGVVTAYLGPDAGDALSGVLDDVTSGTLAELGAAGSPVTALQDSLDDTKKSLKDFDGMAATVRFDDGGLELEVAADNKDGDKLAAYGDQAGDVVGALPEDTVAALGLSFASGWTDQLTSTGLWSDEMVDQIGSALGIDVPADLETLVGDGVALAVSPDVDLDQPTGVGLRVQGDTDGIESVLTKLRAAAAGQDGGLLDSDTKDGAVAIGPDADFRKQLLGHGGLGDSGRFEKVVEHSDGAAVIGYVDFDGGNDWLQTLAEGDDDVRDNLEPLDALGLSSWSADGTGHLVLKVTTD